MNDRQKKFSRRDAIKIATLGAAALFFGAVTNKLQASGTSKASKSAMQYRDEPNGKEKCSNCMQFIPGKTPADSGECKVVAGSISANGWCAAYAPKS